MCTSINRQHSKTLLRFYPRFQLTKEFDYQRIKGILGKRTKNRSWSLCWIASINQPLRLIFAQPSNLPTVQPSNLPTFQPSNLPTFQPSNLSTFQPFNLSTLQPFPKVSRNRRNDQIPWKVIISRDFVVLLFLDTFCIQRILSFGRLECWKAGRLKGWKVGRLECWKAGRLEGWKVRRLE